MQIKCIHQSENNELRQCFSVPTSSAEVSRHYLPNTSIYANKYNVKLIILYMINTSMNRLW